MEYTRAQGIAMDAVGGFSQIAPYLTHPLVLVGFVLLLFFGVHRLLIGSGIIPKLSPTAGGRVLRILLRYGFIIALVIIVLGFALEFWRTTTSNGITIHRGVDEERFQRLAEELGITNAALRSFFRVIEERQVAAEDLDSTLRDIARRYRALQEQIARFRSDDPQVAALKREAGEALAAGDFRRAEVLLDEAGERDLEAARALEGIARQRLLSAAASRAENGELKLTQLAYGEAADYFRAAAELVPVGEDAVLGDYLDRQGTAALQAGLHEQAAVALERALALREADPQAGAARVADSLNNLAELEYALGRYGEAESLFRRALDAQESVLGSLDPALARTLNNLAELFRVQGRFEESEALLRRALAIREQALGASDPAVAQSLNNLAALHFTRGRYADAEPLLRRSLEIEQTHRIAEHPAVSQTMANLATLHSAQGRPDLAGPLLREALARQERILGAAHPVVALTLNNLAEVLRAGGEHAEAEQLYRRSLLIREHALGSDHPDVAQSLNNLAALHVFQGRHGEAATLFARARGIWERELGAGHPLVGLVQVNQGLLRYFEGEYAVAGDKLGAGRDVLERALGPRHPLVAAASYGLAAALERAGHHDEATVQRGVATAIWDGGDSGPDTIASLEQLSDLYQARGHHAEALPLARRALALLEDALGPEHPRVLVRREKYTALVEAAGGDTGAALSRNGGRPPQA